jgi:hypothetical protein
VRAVQRGRHRQERKEKIVVEPRRVLATATVCLVAGLGLSCVGTGEAVGFSLAGVGFRGPECAVHDEQGDVYLVSNINGNPSSHDGNGFISRISPSGEVLALNWVDGRTEGTTLHAPKGMAIDGDLLYVADIDTLRVFDRETGASVESIPIPGARFLNDVASAPDGSIYVSDTATGTVYRITLDRVITSIPAFPGCNGVVATEEALYVVGWDDGRVIVIDLQTGDSTRIATVREAGLDGLVLLDDGTLLVSSVGASAILRVDHDGAYAVLLDGLASPADIGYDKSRSLVLIPLIDSNRLVVKPLSS